MTTLGMELLTYKPCGHILTFPEQYTHPAQLSAFTFYLSKFPFSHLTFILCLLGFAPDYLRVSASQEDLPHGLQGHACDTHQHGLL